MIKSFSGQVVFCFAILRAISAYVGGNWLSQYILVSNINKHLALDSILADCQHGHELGNNEKLAADCQTDWKIFRENSIFDLGVKDTQNVAQYPLHHVTFSATKFEVATSNHLGGDTFTRKYIIWPWGQGHTKCLPVSSTSCDLFTYKVWSCYLLRFRRRYIYKKRDGWLWHEIKIPFFSKEKGGYNEKRVTNGLDPDQDQTLVINQQGTEVATSKEKDNLLPHRDTF